MLDEAEDSGRSIGIETRGEGGYALLPGSRHPNGKTYTAISGDFAAIPVIPMDRVQLLLAAARNLCEAPQTRQQMEKAAKAKVKVRKAGKSGPGVIQQWNEKVPIREMLVRAGYIPFGDRFTRPGPGAMPGGVVVFDESGRSFHHSSNDQLHDGHAHDSFSVFCETQHGGDAKAAVKAAAAELGLNDQGSGGGGGSENGIVAEDDDEDRPKKSQATAMVKMVVGNPEIELFHTPGGHDAEGYATIPAGSHRETWAINSKPFKRWLSKQFFQLAGKAPGSQALSDACNVIAGYALYEGPEHEVHVRLAEVGSSIWLDLADIEWRAIEITSLGWRVVSGDKVPVKFIRKRGMLSLPEPVRGGSINELRELVNLPQDDQWILCASWLLAALRPNRPTPILNVNGEQGSAKSTLSRMLRGLIDPNKAPLRSPPKDERDLVIAASNSLVVAFDNLSGLPPALSDALCRLSTGGGFGARELYSDDAEKLFDSLRPVLINGIDDVATRPDALDRCLNVSLTAIGEDQRRDEDELWAEYNRRRPRILGALLDAVSTALRHIATTRLARKPRMADFALWVVAAETSLPWAAGRFMDVYVGNRDEAHTLAIEASAVGFPILAMVKKKRRWAGAAGELLLELNNGDWADETTRRRVDWPKGRKAMANDLRRIAPNLRARGVAVTLPSKGVGHDKKRIFVLEQVGGSRSASSAQPATPTDDPGNAGDTNGGADHAQEDADHAPNGRSADVQAQSPPGDSETPPANHADRAGHRFPTRSENGQTSRSLADGPCFTCKRRDWWRLPDKPDGWTCGGCHPPVAGLEVVWAQNSDELEIPL